MSEHSGLINEYYQKHSKWKIWNNSAWPPNYHGIKYSLKWGWVQAVISTSIAIYHGNNDNTLLEEISGETLSFERNYMLLAELFVIKKQQTEFPQKL